MTQFTQKKLNDKMDNLLEIYNGLKSLQRLKIDDFKQFLKIINKLE